MDDDTERRLEDAIRAAMPSDVLPSEWVLVMGLVGADDGRPTIEVLTSEGLLQSHTIGTLRAAQIIVEDHFRECGR